jgi:thiamine pyrophosphate-dependent acetolactate synthase large subunit-like protein
MNGADAVARILQQEGVEFLFAYPNHPVINAAAALGIRPIIARTEKTLLNMTDGFTRMTNGRQIGVCVVQGGPGIENAFGGVAQAAADHTPILLLPGGPDQRRLGIPGEFDPQPTYRTVTKWTTRINAAERIPELMRRAFAQLRSGERGPVLVELPRDVTAATVDEATLTYTRVRGYRSAGDPADVAEAAQLLLGARRPLLHVGHGVLWAEAWDELRELAELVGVPVMTTMAGKSAFPEDHPLSVGAGGATLARAAAHCLVHADLIFGIGCSFAQGGFSTPLPPGKRLVQVTSDARDINRDLPVEVGVVGDAKLVLRQLIAEVRGQLGADGARERTAITAEIRTVREAEWREWSPRLTADEAPINPYRVIHDLMRTVDRHTTVITHDSGNPRDQMLTFFETLEPRGYLGWGKSTQLGTGLGMALGAKLAAPEKLVINVMGDLAFGTAGLEIETAVRERLPIMTVLLNNSRLGGYGHHMPIASERYGSNKLTGRYAEMAAALGAYSERVEQPDAVIAAIERGIAATREGRPVVLEMITKEEPVYPSARDVLRAVS